MAKLPFELKGKTVNVAGHRGMVGSALVRRLAREGIELLTASRSETDLRDQASVNRWTPRGRRYPEQIARRQPSCQTRLASQYRVGGRHPEGLSGVFEPIQTRGRVTLVGISSLAWWRRPVR